MSTRGDLAISKSLVGDCAVEGGDEVNPGDPVTWELCVENTTSEPVTVNIYDEINPYTMDTFVWSGVDVASGVTTGSAGGGIDVIDETLVLAPCAKFVYTIVATSPVPFCGTMSNSARFCTPKMKKPEYVPGGTVYVGVSKSKTCLVHDSMNFNDAAAELWPDDGRASILFDFIEQYDWVDIILSIAPLVAKNEKLKPINPDYEGFKEEKEKRDALAERQAAAEARRQAALDQAPADERKRAAE